MAFVPLTADQEDALGTNITGGPDRNPGETRKLEVHSVLGASQSNLTSENYYGHPVGE